MTTEFYVQVKSNASTEEFPDNTSNKFKNRLPHVLERDRGIEQYHITRVPQEIHSDEIEESVLVSISMV